ncbi:transposase [Lewinella sp. W8]|uniref:transposase n=1 Tax=Lewinella sp. W8 TaxID=2528208 RepID=UPI0010676B4B|nr:transposase [Lewinella sp. W8]MTB49701.1 transposase [Lewinella sp. W8]
MTPTPPGVIAARIWTEIPDHFPDWRLGEFVVMPNHVHGILIKQSSPQEGLPAGANVDQPSEMPGDGDVRPPSRILGDADVSPPSKILGDANVETGHALSLHPAREKSPGKTKNSTPAQRRFRNPGKNTLSAVVGSYKSAVTREVRRGGHDFAWQARFHDVIIRDSNAYFRIAQYITHNVENWREDRSFG